MDDNIINRNIGNAADFAGFTDTFPFSSIHSITKATVQAKLLWDFPVLVGVLP